ncbi:DUF1476 domain-containing protein [Limibacillus halophilus]|jgi:hypothetical protein
MTTFNDREKAFEDKYSHDQELQFKVEVRRNKLLGLWAAEMLDKKGDEAQAYAKEVISSDFDEPGDDDVLRKVLGDLQAAGVDFSEHRLRHKMDELLSVAKQQVMTE